MGLINTTAKNRVWINGIDVTTAVIRGSVTDDSAIGAAIVATNGDIECSNYAGTQNMLDIDRSTFPVGSEVIIATELPNGNIVRHPRGLLYVMNSTVNIEERTINFKVGCSLALLAENENAYPAAVEQLWAFASSEILATCDIETQDLSTLNTVLIADGKALYQNQYGQIWAVDLFETGAGGAPAVVVTDKHTAINIAATEDPSVIAPSGYKVLASYGIFRPKDVKDGTSDPQDGDPDGQPGYDDGDGSGTPTIGGQSPNTDGSADRTPGGTGKKDDRLTGPYRKWSNETVNGYGKYDKWERWNLLVYSGMKLPEERDDGMYNSWCSWFYGYRPDPAPPAEPSWAYAISANEVITVETTYPNEVRSTTTKYYNDNGQETASDTVEQATWKSIGQSTIDIIVDRAKQLSDYWLNVAQDCLGKINTALTSRDEHPRGSSAFYYYHCVHSHWVDQANSALGLARSWWSYGARVKDSGRQMAWSRKSVTYNTYGNGGEVIRKETLAYENEATTQIYTEKLKVALERGATISESLAFPKALVQVSTTIEETTYNSDGSAVTRTSVVDLQDPSRNSVTVSWDGESRNAPPLTGGSGGNGNNDPIRDKNGKRTKSTPGEAPTPDPDNPGQDLPYPETWNGLIVDSVTGELRQPKECTVEVEQIELESQVPGSLSNTPSVPAGWLGQQQSYLSQIQFPLQLKGDRLLTDEVTGDCVPVPSSMAAAVAVVNRFANAYAAIERGKDGGFAVSEQMRPEMYNLRPLSRVDMQLQTLGIGFRCRVDNAVWAFDQNQSLVSLNLFKTASFAYNVPPSAPVYNVPVLPPNQETFGGVNPPDTSSPPSWAYSDPYSGATSGDAPATPSLVDATGAVVDPVDLPSTDASLEPLAPPSVSQFVYPRLVLNVRVAKVTGYSWDYGGFSLPTGMPLDLGTITTPYYKDYDFTGIVVYDEPVPLP